MNRKRAAKIVACLIAGTACASGYDAADDAGGHSVGGAATGGSGGNCARTCAPDLAAVLDCHGEVVETCAPRDGCHQGACIDGCEAAHESGRSIGCEHYAIMMDQYAVDVCFAVFVTNPWKAAAHLTVEYAGADIALGDFARVVVGFGPTLEHQPFDAAAGIPPGGAVALFLSGPDAAWPPEPGAPPTAHCPVPSAVPSGVMLHAETGIGAAFRIGSDVPVAMWQMSPYGGPNAATPGASLLLPTAGWGQNYLVVAPEAPNPFEPSVNIVAMADDTAITLRPYPLLDGGGGIPSGSMNAPVEFTLNRGEHAQLTQAYDLSGSVIEATKPVGLFTGHRCLFLDGSPLCDHAEQMIPPIASTGHEYVGVMHRPRAGEPARWRAFGIVDGTVLSWSSDVGGPASLERGMIAEFITDEPFVVRSQDASHPFQLFSYMGGSGWGPWLSESEAGDPDFVLTVAPEQYLPAYTFYADPTFPETSLVVVRPEVEGAFADVELDCAGVLEDWHALGGGYQWTRVDLGSGDFMPNGDCTPGARTIHSDQPFGLWVWGWGSPAVSYGYPAGMSTLPLNDVVVPARME